MERHSETIGMCGIRPGQRIPPHPAEREAVHAGFIRPRQHGARLPELPDRLGLREEGRASFLLGLNDAEHRGKRIAQVLPRTRSFLSMERIARQHTLDRRMLSLPAGQPVLKLGPRRAEVQEDQQRQIAAEQ